MATPTNPIERLSREERSERLTRLRAREAARKLIFRGVPLLELPLQQRLMFVLFDPGAITPRGDDYSEPLGAWQARAITYLLPEVAS